MIFWISARVSQRIDVTPLQSLTIYSRIVEAGRMTMESVSYSLRQTVFGILKTLVVRASQNHLDLTYDVECDIPDQLIGDSLRLRQVSYNEAVKLIHG